MATLHITPASTPPGPGDSSKRARIAHVTPLYDFTITPDALAALEQDINAPIAAYEAMQARIAAGDEEALALKAVTDQWQAKRDAAYAGYCNRVSNPVPAAKYHDLVEILGDHANLVLCEDEDMGTASLQLHARVMARHYLAYHKRTINPVTYARFVEIQAELTALYQGGAIQSRRADELLAELAGNKEG